MAWRSDESSGTSSLSKRSVLERQLFRHAEACKRVLDLVDKVLLRALLALDHAPKRRRARDLVEAVDARDFLRKVFHVRAVIAPRRHRDMVALIALGLNLKAQRRQDLDHLLARDSRAESAIDLVRRVVDRHRLLLIRVAVNDALRDRAGTHVLQELAGALECARRVRHIDTTLKAARSLRVQAAGARRAADARPVERRSFEHDGCRLLRDLCLKAAHDAGKTCRMLGIGNDELRPLGEARAVVERVEILARFCETGRQRVARDLIVVVGVHRLAELDHDEVRHIDDIVNGADASTLEALLHPLRRRTDLDVLDDARAEAVAEVARLDADRDHVCSLGCIILLAGDDRPFWLVARQHGNLAHKADDTEAVAAVCRELELEHDIVEAEHILGRHADRRALWQDVDAVLLLFCQLREVEVELTGRTEHAVRRQATQLALLDVKTVRQVRADHRDRHDLAFCHILRARDDLDEFLLHDLKMQGAAIDSWGVGTNLITSKDCPSFGGVYKLAAIQNEEGEFVPKIKISENTEKITNPGNKTIYRIYEKASGKIKADLICFADEVIDPKQDLLLFDPMDTWKKTKLAGGTYTVREILLPIFKNGECLYKSPTLKEIAAYCREEKDTLWDETKRLFYPHRVYVDLSQKLYDVKQSLLDQMTMTD